MVQCSGNYSPDVSEVETEGLTPIRSDLVRRPRVKDSRVQMECRLLQVVTISTEPGGGSLVIGEVLRFHIDESVLAEGRVDADRLQPIGRMGGIDYVRTTDRFSMARPKL